MLITANFWPISLLPKMPNNCNECLKEFSEVHPKIMDFYLKCHNNNNGFRPKMQHFKGVLSKRFGKDSIYGGYWGEKTI